MLIDFGIDITKPPPQHICRKPMQLDDGLVKFFDEARAAGLLEQFEGGSLDDEDIADKLEGG